MVWRLCSAELPMIQTFMVMAMETPCVLASSFPTVMDSKSGVVSKRVIMALLFALLLRARHSGASRTATMWADAAWLTYSRNIPVARCGGLAAK